MIPKIIHQTTNENSWEERRLAEKTKRLMPLFRHKLWTDEENAALVEEFFPSHIDEYMHFKHGVTRVDIARCLYLYKLGGVYADTDYKFYKPLDDNFLNARCILGIEGEHTDFLFGKKLGNAFMASEPRFALWPDFVESAFARARHGEERVVFIAGPHALSKFVNQSKDYGPAITLADPEVIYPAFNGLKTGGVKSENTIGAHLCWGSWRNKASAQSLKNLVRRKLSAI
jgi:mannosyltransferase OCH1-like enzyme